MQIELLYRPSQTIARVRLDAGESVVAESGALVGMTPDVAVETFGAGLLGGLRRLLGGETVARVRFRAGTEGAEVLLAPPLVGDVSLLDVGTKAWCVRSGAYVASAEGVEIEPRGASVSSWIAGVGATVLETKGIGPLLVAGLGALEPLEVDGRLIVDHGHVLAWETSLSISPTKSTAGWLSTLLSAEGRMCSFEGKGTVLVQSRNAQEYARSVGSRLSPREG